jgi:hypothetical protein
MDKNGLSERLKTVSGDDSKRSSSALLRDVIDDVEAALAAGVSRVVVVDELAAFGLAMSLSAFDTALHRIRKKNGKPSVKQVTSVKSNNQLVTKTIQPVNKPSMVELEDDEEPPLVVSHDPRDIDAIMRSTPDLEYYAKIARENRRKKKS